MLPINTHLEWLLSIEGLDQIAGKGLRVFWLSYPIKGRASIRLKNTT
jgi:hypothetical protein